VWVGLGEAPGLIVNVPPDRSRWFPPASTSRNTI
jgi:hypothetical protein